MSVRVLSTARVLVVGLASACPPSFPSFSPLPPPHPAPLTCPISLPWPSNTPMMTVWRSNDSQTKKSSWFCLPATPGSVTPAGERGNEGGGREEGSVWERGVVRTRAATEKRALSSRAKPAALPSISTRLPFAAPTPTRRLTCHADLERIPRRRRPSAAVAASSGRQTHAQAARQRWYQRVTNCRDARGRRKRKKCRAR